VSELVHSQSSRFRQLLLAIRHLPSCVIFEEFPPVGLFPAGLLNSNSSVAVFCDTTVRCGVTTSLRRNSRSFSILLSVSLLLFISFATVLSQRHSLGNLGPAWSQTRLASLAGRYSPRVSHPRPNHNLLFDPVLAYATFLGGASNSGGGDPGVFQVATVVFVDGSGNVYVGGQTNSPSFPVTSGVIQPTQGNSTSFVAKLEPTGESLLFSTYLTGIDGVSAMTVDAAGNIYVAGLTDTVSNGAVPLPIPPGSTPFQAAAKGINVGILKLNSTATAILSGTYLGGSAQEFLSGLAVDSSDNLYVTGSTTSNDFPTQAPLQSSLGSGGRSVFVTVLNPALSTAIYSTYLGQNSMASSFVGPHGIAVDGSKNAYIVGQASLLSH
jgi:hypothetical protein